MSGSQLLFFALSVCKSFRVSSAMIDPSYHIILLLHHPGFDSNSQTVPRKYPGESIPIKSIYQLDLVRCIMRRSKTEKERHRFFYSIPDKNGAKKHKQTAMSCQNRSITSSYRHLPDQSQFFKKLSFYHQETA